MWKLTVHFSIRTRTLKKSGRKLLKIPELNDNEKYPNPSTTTKAVVRGDL